MGLSRLALAGVFYRRLMPVTDDFGRYHADPTILRSQLYPLRPDTHTDLDFRQSTKTCYM